MFSAIKIEGARAYDLARVGETFEIAARPIHVYRLDLVAVEPDGATFEAECGKGAYVRSLARQQGGRISIGRDQARSYTRETAIAALHVVRRAGRGAWLVPHPGKLVRGVAA